MSPTGCCARIPSVRSRWAAGNGVSIPPSATSTIILPPTNPYVQEHTDLVDSIRAGRPLNELRQVAESTLTAIMGREAAYTGQEITWDEILNAPLDLTPPTIALGPLPLPAVAMPGRTRLSRIWSE
jgi:hypothetical protein